MIASAALQTAIEAKDMEIAALNKEMAQVNEQIKTYMGRVETVPAGARQYGDLLREKDIAKAKYVNLDNQPAKGADRAGHGRPQAGRDAGTAGSAFAAAQSDGAEAPSDHFDRRGGRACCSGS